MFEQDFINGFFFLAVVAISLLRLLNGKEYRTLSLVKNTWGRTQGLALHFLVYVGLPLVIGIFFLARSIAGFGATGEFYFFAPVHHEIALHYIDSLDFPMTRPGEVTSNGEIALLLASNPPELFLSPRDSLPGFSLPLCLP